MARQAAREPEGTSDARAFDRKVHVTAKVEPVIGRGEKQRGPLIDYLRDLEALARRQCGSRETVQIIASGRRLLGDRSEIGPPDGSFTRG